MGNHFHDVLNTPNGNLSEFMQQVEGQFARWSNWRHGRVGHLFQSRFRDVLIEHDVHLLTALVYVFMNPVAAGFCAEPQNYKWGTYAATVGREPIPDYLTIDWLSALLPAETMSESQQKLVHLMSQPTPIAAYLDDDLLVDPETVRMIITSYTGLQIQYATLPRTYRDALRPSLSDLVQATDVSQEQFIYEARVVYGYKNVEIARALHMHPATVSKKFRHRQRLSHAA